MSDYQNYYATGLEKLEPIFQTKIRQCFNAGLTYLPGKQCYDLDLIEAHLKLAYENNIPIKIETKQQGVARDIVEEARSGSDTIVLGKRGISGIKDFLLGSISQKVLHAAKGVSVLLVD